MKRIAIFFGRLVVVIVTVALIVLLVRATSGSVNEMLDRAKARNMYNTRQPSFPLAATTIAADNAQISFQMTHAPSVTPTATDDPNATNGDQSNQSDNGGNDLPPTLTPTSIPTLPPTHVPATSTLPPTVPPTNTKRPSVQAIATNTPSPIPTTEPTIVPTTNEPPTQT